MVGYKLSLYFFFVIKQLGFVPIVLRPCSPYHDYDYSYLMYTTFLDNIYMGDFSLSKNVHM